VVVFPAIPVLLGNTILYREVFSYSIFARKNNLFLSGDTKIVCWDDELYMLQLGNQMQCKCFLW